MRRELYHVLNLALILILALFFCAFQTVILRIRLISWLELDLILLTVLYLGLRRNMLEGSVLTLVLARIAEVHSGSPAGLLVSTYMVVYGLTVLTRELFLMEGDFSIVLAGVLGGVTWKISFLILMALMDRFANVWQPAILFLIPYLAALGLFARPVFYLLERIDSLTASEPSLEFR